MAYTGYIVRKYIDENPNSPTYGETWTEKTLDTTHCPNDGGGWSLVATECELVTSGFTGYRIDTYYNSVTNDYRTERTLDSLCQASTDDEIWYNIGDVYCEQNDDGTYTGFGIQEQKQINPNLYNFGIVRKTRVASPECQEHLEPEWQDIQKECNIVQEPGTGNLHYDGTANILQIDINPSSPTFNQTRTINVEDEECVYVPCDRMEYEWHYIEDSCGSLIPEYYRIENLVPNTIYKIYQMYSKCYVDDIVVREKPESIYSAVTYQEGVEDCLYRWVQTEETICRKMNDERWVNSGTTCDDANKYNLQVKEITEDGGQTWSATSETRLGALIEENSYDCGYRTRTISGDPFCSGYNKYIRVYNQVSKDSGETWETTTTRLYTLEINSVDCGYVPGYDEQYLTFEPLTSGTFTFSGTSSSTIDNTSIQYSIDSGSTWSTLRAGESTPTVQAGQKIYWKGNLNPVYESPTMGIGRFGATNNFKAYGNVMSLLYGNNFASQRSLSGKRAAFAYLFSRVYYRLRDIDNLKLPATTLEKECYYGMFNQCRSLTSVPSDLLPATTMKFRCYTSMFYGCYALTTLPSLPANNLAKECYGTMYGECTSLTTVPSGYLPSTSLADRCYYGMFMYCSALATVPTNLLPATTLTWSQVYNSMFAGCTSLTTAPYLSATGLTSMCYRYMFSGCTSLNYIRCLAKDSVSSLHNPDIVGREDEVETLAKQPFQDSVSNWAIDVSSSGTFVKNNTKTDWPRGTSGIPSGWSIQNV